MESFSKLTFFTILAVLLSLQGCAAPQSGFHSPDPSQLSKTQLTLAGVTKDQVLNSIINVMTTAGYKSTSINPHQAVFEKPVTSNTYQTFWGHSKGIRISYTLSEIDKSTRISTNIQGIVRTSQGLLGSFAPGEEIRDYNSNEKAQKLVKDLLVKIESDLQSSAPVPSSIAKEKK